MSDITRHNTALPANFGSQLMKGIAEVRSTLVLSDGGKPLLRLLKTGVWVYSQQNLRVPKGTEWAVNIASLARGWVCWGDGELLGQAMASVQVERLPQPAPVNDVAFVEQFGMELTCISEGETEGLVVSYKNNSYGFKKAFEKLLADIADRWSTDKTYFWPIVELHQTSYDHKKYGETFNPILEVTGWTDQDGEFVPEQDEAESLHHPALQPAPKPEPEPEPAPVKRTRGRPRTELPPPSDYADDAPAPTAQTHIGQRRRPASR